MLSRLTGNRANQKFHTITRKSAERIAPFTANFSYLNYNITQHKCEVVSGILLYFLPEIDQFRYIKIQPKTDLSTRLWGRNTKFVGFISQSLVLRSIVLGWILIYRNWPIALHPHLITVSCKWEKLTVKRATDVE